MDQQAVKLYYSHPSPAMSSRHYPLDGSVPWASSHPWDQEGTFLDAHLMGGGSSIPEKSSGASMGNRDHQSLEGGNIVDPLLRCDTAIEHDLMQQLPGPLVTIAATLWMTMMKWVALDQLVVTCPRTWLLSASAGRS